MRKTIKLLLAILLVGNSTMGVAQKNVAKLGLFGLASRNVKLQYERVLTQRMSVQLSGSFLLNRDLPGSLTEGLVSSDDQNTGFQNYISSTFLKGMSIIPEMRIYSKKKEGAPKGFYFGPYLRYAKYSVGWEGFFDNAKESVIGSIRSFGAGLSLGAHWIIADRVSIDWNFISIGFNSNQFKLETVRNGGYFYATPEELAALESDIANDFSDIPLLGNKISVEVNGNSAAIIANFLTPAIRSGLTIGVAF